MRPRARRNQYHHKWAKQSVRANGLRGGATPAAGVTPDAGVAPAGDGTAPTAAPSAAGEGRTSYPLSSPCACACACAVLLLAGRSPPSVALAGRAGLRTRGVGGLLGGGGVRSVEGVRGAPPAGWGETRTRLALARLGPGEDAPPPAPREGGPLPLEREGGVRAAASIGTVAGGLFALVLVVVVLVLVLHDAPLFGFGLRWCWRRPCDDRGVRLLPLLLRLRRCPCPCPWWPALRLSRGEAGRCFAARR